MADELWVELCDAVDDCAAPVVTAEDEVWRLDGFGEVGDEVGVVFEGVVGEVGGEALGTYCVSEFDGLNAVGGQGDLTVSP